MNKSTNPPRALLIFNMNPHGISERAGAEKLLPFIKGELQYFRERSRPVFFIRTKDQAKRAFVKELMPRRGEVILDIENEDAFSNSRLEEHLRHEKVARLTLTGLETHKHLLPTALHANDLGFQVSVPAPCAGALDNAVHEEAMAKIRELPPPLQRESLKR